MALLAQLTNEKDYRFWKIMLTVKNFKGRSYPTNLTVITPRVMMCKESANISYDR